MRTVVSRVKLSEIGVVIGAVRRTREGRILLQVKNKEEADKLSGRLQSAVGDIAKIGRPVRTTPVLITNVPDWMDDEYARSILGNTRWTLDRSALGVMNDA